MSQENVEIVRSMYEAFNDGDRERAITHLHPDAELHQPPTRNGGGALEPVAQVPERCQSQGGYSRV